MELKLCWWRHIVVHDRYQHDYTTSVNTMGGKIGMFVVIIGTQCWMLKFRAHVNLHIMSSLNMLLGNIHSVWSPVLLCKTCCWEYNLIVYNIHCTITVECVWLLTGLSNLTWARLIRLGLQSPHTYPRERSRSTCSVCKFYKPLQ